MIPNEELRKAKILHQIAIRDFNWLIETLDGMGAFKITQSMYALRTFVWQKEDWENLTEDEKSYNIQKARMII